MPSPIRFKDFPVKDRVIAVPERVTRVRVNGDLIDLLHGNSVIGVTDFGGFQNLGGVMLPSWVIDIRTVGPEWYLVGVSLWMSLEDEPDNLEEILNDLRRISPEN